MIAPVALAIVVLAFAACEPEMPSARADAFRFSDATVFDDGGAPPAPPAPPAADARAGSCAAHAAVEGWHTFKCEATLGSGECGGLGVATSDCAACCKGPSCGGLANKLGWADPQCDNALAGGGPCDGSGVKTYDCPLCCDKPSAPPPPPPAPPPATKGFGFPVGDKSTPPAGGYAVWQVMAHYWSAYSGRHLAQDVSAGGAASINAPVYAIADGTVRYAKSNTSSYKYVLLIEHDVGDGTKVCSFFGHINAPLVSAGEKVTRGQKVATIRDWAKCVTGGASSNTHLHYVLLSEALCKKAAATGATSGGSGICGYDKGDASNGVGYTDLSSEPEFYTSVGDNCGSHTVPNGFISPSKFISKHLYTKSP